MRETANAKINLFLHVTGKRPDGYHDIASLFTFADCADVLQVRESEKLTLEVSGPFAAKVPHDETNLALRAAIALKEAVATRRGAALQLEKHLPVASGMGGGSADAAAVLRALPRLWKLQVPQSVLMKIALMLGSDVPACLYRRNTWATGRGEVLQPAVLPPLTLLLANPGVAVSTAEAYGRVQPPYHKAPPAFPRFATPESLIAWLKKTRNDLEAPATQLVPEISKVLQALEAQPGCRLARMSGSGATCFAIYENAPAADKAAEALASFSGWWVRKAAV